MKKLAYFSSLTVTCMLTACGYVAVQPQAKEVLVLPPDRTASCQYLGKTQVSVSSKFRIPAAVEGDLRNVAKNQAAAAGGDTITPLAKPADGTQTFAMYKCVNASDTSQSNANRRKAKNGVQTHPYHPPPH